MVVCQVAFQGRLAEITMLEKPITIAQKTNSSLTR
jgi:hypothetical protein